MKFNFLLKKYTVHVTSSVCLYLSFGLLQHSYEISLRQTEDWCIIDGTDVDVKTVKAVTPPENGELLFAIVED